jgi:protein phosphatase
VVTRALGGESEVVVDVREVEVMSGDIYILCSDGLSTLLNDDEIQRRLMDGQPIEEICRGLVRDANTKGGLDNITVVLIQIESDDETDA